jgi:peptidoglycan/LPS O-acetylase OafA/YrhL
MLMKNIRLAYRVAIIIVGIYYVVGLNGFDGITIRLDFLRVIIYFAIGVAFYSICKDKRLNLAPLVLIAALYLAEGSVIEVLINLILSVAVIFTGLYLRSLITIKSDYSYGIYLYAWPVSQAVCSLGLDNFNISILIAFVILITLSYASWVFVEKPLLKKKGLLSSHLNAIFNQK